MLTLFLLLPAAGALLLLFLPEDERIKPRTIALHRNLCPRRRVLRR